MSTAYYSHPECRLHDMGAGHPECPQRLDAIADHLRATGLDIALEFIRASERHLAPGGEVWVVANHFLPYEREMARIGTVREVARGQGFKVLAVRGPGPGLKAR